MYSVKKQSLLKKQKSRFSSDSTQNLSWTFCRLIYHFNLIPRSRPTVEWKDYPLKTRVFDQSSNDFVLNVYCTFILREEFQKRNRSGSEIKQPTITNPMEQKGASFPTQSFIVKLRTLFHNLFITDIGFIRETRMSIQIYLWETVDIISGIYRLRTRFPSSWEITTSATTWKNKDMKRHRWNEDIWIKWVLFMIILMWITDVWVRYSRLYLAYRLVNEIIRGLSRPHEHKGRYRQ